MQVTVLYFAQLRERRGAATETLELPADGDVAMALATIAKRYPAVGAPSAPAAGGGEPRGRPCDAGAVRRGRVGFDPPVSGGSDSTTPDEVGSNRTAPVPPLRIAVVPVALQLERVVEAVVGPDRGGLVTFTGIVRRKGQIPDVIRLEYEAYRAMAEKVLADIADEIEQEIAGARVAIHHRVGSLLVGEAAVMVAAAAPHRAEAFDACRAAIDRLKQRAPIWKKEIGENSAAWIEHCC